MQNISNKKSKEKTIKVSFDLSISQIICDLILDDKIKSKKLLATMQRYAAWEGAPATTMLPIVTNEHSVDRFELCLILKYVLEKWDEVKIIAAKYCGDQQKKIKNTERRT
jgi:hypothetical protein